MITPDSVYCIGRIGKTHGLKGELSFVVDDDIFDTTAADYVFLLLDGVFVPFFIEDYRFVSDERALIKFDDVDSLAQATPLVGATVFFPIDSAAGATTASTLAHTQGYTICDGGGGATAPIAAIDTSTDNRLFVLTDGTLIPLVEEWIERIDHDKRIIYMTLPEGLLTL